jgi:large subunit ribosomal protein L5
MTRLLDYYRQDVLPKLGEELGRSNRHALPRLEKICINMGLGQGLVDAKIYDQAIEDITTITGQRAVITTARKAVSNFKVRKGYKVGARVTLRGARMYEFFDRLVNVAMPRIRDFQGVKPTAFDGQGNYSLGLDEQTIFPEIDPDKSESPLGMDVTLVIRNSNGPAESRRFLELMGMPFMRKESA